MAFGKGGQAQAATFVVDLVLLQIKEHVHFSRNSIHHSLDALLSYINFIIYWPLERDGEKMVFADPIIWGLVLTPCLDPLQIECLLLLLKNNLSTL